MRFCLKCQLDKPKEGFVCRAGGRFGRTKVYMCADCAARVKACATAAQRDAFGREVTKRNGTRQSDWKLNGTNN